MAVLSRHWLRTNPIRVFFIAIGLAVLPVAIFLLVAHRIYNHEATQRVLATSSQSGKLIGTMLQSRLSEKQAFLESLAVRPDLLRAWQQENYEDIRKILQPLQRLRPDFLNLGVVDLHGTVRAAVPPLRPDLLAQNYSTRDWYTGVTRQWKPYISSAYEPPDVPGYVVSIAIPIRDQADNPVGILVARQTLDDLTRDIYDLSGATNANLIFFVDQRGQVIGKQDSKVAVIPSYQPLLAAVTQPGKPPAERIQLDGREYIASYTPIADLGWGVFLRIPVQVIAAIAWQTERTIVILGVVILVLAIAGSAIVALLFKRLHQSEERYQREIEEQNRVLEQRTADLQESNAALEAFSYSVSHDLRAPLRSVSGLGAMVIEDYGPRLDDTGRGLLARMIASAQRMDDLIANLLAYSRLSKRNFETEAVSLEAAIRDARQQLEAEVERTGAEIRAPGPFPSVMGNHSLLTQAIANLMSNAVKFVPQGVQPRIDVSAETHDARVRLWVRDNGIGIPAEYTDKVFKPFERLQGGERYPGSGIGLAIVSKAVERMSGEFGVDSVLGKGSGFWIELPQAPIA